MILLGKECNHEWTKPTRDARGNCRGVRRRHGCGGNDGEPAARAETGLGALPSGGIGKAQQTAIKEAASGYPLELEFVKDTKAPREFLTGVNVDIKDSSGKAMLSTSSAGPFLLEKLPDGTYSVSATDAGSTETRSVTLAEGKHQRVLFDWK